jgi:alpha-ketoglutarate-dependent taurine dioxygenase
VVHSLEATQRLTYPDPSPELVAQWRTVPDKVHPLAWTHRSGRRSLVIGATASHVEGMDVSEGRALLASLDERATSGDRVYRHEWEVGDLVIWDNRGVMHRVCPYDPMSAREMHRTTIAGDEPIR